MAFGAARLALAVGVAACLGGCVVPKALRGGEPLPVAANSQVAKDMAEARRHPGPYPRFAGIPNTPTDVRPSSAWGQAVADMGRRKAKLDKQVAALPPPQTDTEGFAAANRSQVAVAPSEIPPPTRPNRPRPTPNPCGRELRRLLRPNRAGEAKP